ncbi:MAG: tetratricopeptide repeat protein, partial [Rhodospirillales bacterium]|nr:tetratricopeptide repeat protein [Rhodospirillales bacterium]
MSQAQHTKKSLERGLRLHQSGKLDEAGLIYRQVLDQNPGNADALHFLGLIAQQKGDAALAIDLISDAIEIEEPRPTFHFNLAAARLAAGDAAGALNSYRRAAELKPDFDDAHYSIGALLGRSGRAEEALVALDRALELKPDFGEALCAKGAALERLGRSAAAAAACRGALE